MKTQKTNPTACKWRGISGFFDTLADYNGHTYCLFVCTHMGVLRQWWIYCGDLEVDHA